MTAQRWSARRAAVLEPSTGRPGSWRATKARADSPLHLPDGVIISRDDRGKEWRTAVEVELTRKTEARVVAILRHLLATYDDVVYRVHPSAMTVVIRSAAALETGAEWVMIRPYPPPTLAEVA